jgi:outer membrane biosynthesis protein TonB
MSTANLLLLRGPIRRHWIGIGLVVVMHAAVLWWTGNRHPKQSHFFAPTSINVQIIQAPALDDLGSRAKVQREAIRPPSKALNSMRAQELSLAKAVVPHAANPLPTSATAVKAESLSYPHSPEAGLVATGSAPAAASIATPYSNAQHSAGNVNNSSVVDCQYMPEPEMPERARLENLSGIVRAEGTLRNGKVISVEILSSQPLRVFDAAVRMAMLRYSGCTGVNGADITAQRTFEFKVSD